MLLQEFQTVQTVINITTQMNHGLWSICINTSNLFWTQADFYLNYPAIQNCFSFQKWQKLTPKSNLI